MSTEASLSPRFHVDTISSGALPSLEVFEPHNQPEAILKFLPHDMYGQRILELLPPEPVVSGPEHCLIDTAKLSTTARRKAADRMVYVTRGGGSFDEHREFMPIEQVEELAVSAGGLDLSNYFHPAEQTRRTHRVVNMNQIANQLFHRDVIAVYGHTRAGFRAYAGFSAIVESYDHYEYEIGGVAGETHDYAELELKKDIPHDRKRQSLLHSGR